LLLAKLYIIKLIFSFINKVFKYFLTLEILLVKINFISLSNEDDKLKILENNFVVDIFRIEFVRY